MIVDKVAFVAEQLRRISPDAPWDAHEIDRARELAQILVRAGVTDLWALKLIPISYTIEHPAWRQETESGFIDYPAQVEEVKSYAFDYYGRRIGYLGTQDRAENQAHFERQRVGYLIAWSSAGKGHVNYVVQPNKTRTAIEIVPVWGSSSDADFIRESLVSTLGFFAMVALPMAGVSLGAIIGNAVLPASFATAYPAVATAIGNVALSTALNGGDVGGAVKNVAIGAASGFAGGQAGGFLATATGSQLVGNLAEVATRTALAGGDVTTAVGLALAKEGATMFDTTFNATDPASSGGFDFWTTGGNTGFTGDFDFSGSFDMGPGFLDHTLPLPDFQWNVTTPGQSFDDYLQNWPDQVAPGFDVLPPSQIDSALFNPFAENATGTPTTAPAQPTTPPPPNSTIWQPSQIIQGITAAAMAVISVIKAYRSLDQPAINTTARIVRPDGSVSAITNNGLVSTRTPDGRVTTTRPPVGVPQTTVDGNVIVNNGDGTYTIVAPDGRSATYRYSTGTAGDAGGEISPTMLALLAGGAFLLLKK